MPDPARRRALGVVQVNIDVPKELREEAYLILRKQNRTISQWLQGQLHDVIRDYHERKAWELRQEQAQAEKQLQAATNMGK
jgi:hypothetical protein